MEAIKVYKGDDSDFLNLRPITFSVDAEFSLENCKAIFRCQGYREVIPNISGGVIEITLPQESTRKFNTGECTGTLHLVDEDGRKLTIINDLLFDIITDIDSIMQRGAKFMVVITANPLTITSTEVFAIIGSGDTYTVSGYTPITTLDMSDCTNEEMANLVGGLVDTLESAKVLNDVLGVDVVRTGIDYGIYDRDPLYSIDLSDCSQEELGLVLDTVIGSLIKSNIINNGTDGEVVQTNDSYSITGYETLTATDLEDSSFEELCNLVGSVIETLKKSGVVQ